MTRRTERIAEQLRGEISRVLREEVTDPRIRLVTLTRVDVAPDLSNALVYWSAMESSGDGEGEVEDIADGLDSAAPYVRRCLASVLPLRRTPALQFRHDPSLSIGSRILGLLSKLSDGEKT
ncbi:MAG: 30S ribosome-binding factor RbfA [Myxococcales bacterium]|nr:30S ribosome-binding factor RbfA [Myxococcales bacterium]